jgi:hypothetical protein
MRRPDCNSILARLWRTTRVKENGQGEIRAQ